MILFADDSSMIALYPLQFVPFLQDKLWGGRALVEVLHRGDGTCSSHGCYGESWELSALAGRESVVRHGMLAGRSLSHLVRHYGGDLLGEMVYARFGDFFPILVKFIHARDSLSLQTHPAGNDRAVDRAKSECWYVLDASSSARVLLGFDRGLSRASYFAAVQQGDLLSHVRAHEVFAGDVFFIPSGQIHGTFGGELLLAEVQQSADRTYRIFDFNRKDMHGIARPLHVQEAADVLDFSHAAGGKVSYEPTPNTFVPLVCYSHFTMAVCHLGSQQTGLDGGFIEIVHALDTFYFYLCVAGCFSLRYGECVCRLRKGDGILMPACVPRYSLEAQPSATILSYYVESS